MSSVPVVSDDAGRERVVIGSSLVVLSAVAWSIMAFQAWEMDHAYHKLPPCCIPHLQAWQIKDFWAVFVMWAVMMVAMMTPSASPMILTFAAVNRKRQERADAVVPTWIFLSGYIAVWTAFSGLATFLQWYLHHKALVSPGMVSTSNVLSGILLIVAGIFQFTSFKNACLSHCRSPLSFLMTDWQEGTWGAFAMGLKHGLYCTGCCWVLMLLLFVLGVMNIAWIAVLSIFVLLEKVVPAKFRLSAVSGGILIGWGAFLLFACLR